MSTKVGPYSPGFGPYPPALFVHETRFFGLLAGTIAGTIRTLFVGVVEVLLGTSHPRVRNEFTTPASARIGIARFWLPVVHFLPALSPKLQFVSGLGGLSGTLGLGRDALWPLPLGIP